MSKSVQLTITPDAHLNALNIICTEFSSIKWLPVRIKEKCPASKLVDVKDTSNGEPYYCRILLNTYEFDSESIAAWLGRIIIDRGGSQTSDIAYEFNLSNG